MTKNIFVNKNSKDKRVNEVCKLFSDSNIYDFARGKDCSDGGIAFIEPRCEIAPDVLEALPKGTVVFGYTKQMEVGCDNKYVSLNDDEEFVRENNRLTAVAFKEILEKRFGEIKEKEILIIGWGKLTYELEEVLAGMKISILNFNKHKKEQLVKAYGERAYFEQVELGRFDIIVNTIPKKLITEDMLRRLLACPNCKESELAVNPAIYELASAPYGFDFGKLDKSIFDYIIEPSLPGRYFPQESAKAVYNTINRYVKQTTQKPSIVLCITGSSCSYLKLIPVLQELVQTYNVIPCISGNADVKNRFTNIDTFKQSLQEITGNRIISSIAHSETLSSNKRVVASVVFPATGNTIAKLANGITDTPVTMAVKALLRNDKPCIIGMSTNDALSGNAENIGKLLARKNYYFVPFSQDDPHGKPYSIICDFSKVGATIEGALKGRQVQPIIS